MDVSNTETNQSEGVKQYYKTKHDIVTFRPAWFSAYWPAAASWPQTC